MASSSRTRAFWLSIVSFLAFVSCTESRTARRYEISNYIAKRASLPSGTPPALYTGDFGDCLGGQSLFNVTKFDAAYYAQNLSIVFHLSGASNIRNDTLTMHMLIHAYGGRGLDLTIDPCSYNISSLCPLLAGKPIDAFAVIRVTQEQIDDIPSMAFSMPDVEGSAAVQIFSNTSKTEIGCFQASLENGMTLSHPEVAVPILAIFTAVTIVASFLAAAYGVSVSHMRMHHAHSLSTLVVFETLQYVFFSGALSVYWPSILVGWWGNFAWSAGQIYSSGVIRSLDSFAGINGNASQVGGAGSTVIANGGGLITSISGRSVEEAGVIALARRATDTNGNLVWAGGPVTPGMPTPGTWYGFAGALSGAHIPAADAFLVGLIWFLAAFGLAGFCVAVFKYSLEALVRIKLVKEDRLAYFREHWLVFGKLALERTFLVGFFMMMTLTMYQFNLNGSKGATAVAAVVFVIFLVGMAALVTSAIRTRTRLGKFEVVKDQIVFHTTKLFNVWPLVISIRASTLQKRNIDTDAVGAIATIPFFRIRHVNPDGGRPAVHRDEEYVKRFGWLTARYRRTRWWFFAYYTGYQFVRACFLGGAAKNPEAQVYGLLVFEVVSFIVVLQLDPWEGSRNTALAVYLLSFSKILTTGLSISFLQAVNIDRASAVVIGIVIIAIQGLLVVALLILAALSMISTWLSMTRNQEEFEPDWLDSIRIKYFTVMEKKALDTWQPKPKEDKKGKGKATEEEDESDRPGMVRSTSFSVKTVRRTSNIADEEKDVVDELGMLHNPSVTFDTNLIHGPTRSKRASSVSSRHSASSLRKSAGRPHRTSWSSKDFAQWDALQADRSDSSLAQRLSSANGSAASNVAGYSSSHAAKNSVGSFRPRSPPLSPIIDIPDDVSSVRVPTPPETSTASPSLPSLSEADLPAQTAQPSSDSK
ncbi:TRP-domain-containing protein [Thozetella sp. PMI_491]|nr:TRP-domain-containing protein [Thozetella sp. PMI_491]